MGSLRAGRHRLMYLVVAAALAAVTAFLLVTLLPRGSSKELPAGAAAVVVLPTPPVPPDAPSFQPAAEPVTSPGAVSSAAPPAAAAVSAPAAPVTPAPPPPVPPPAASEDGPSIAITSPLPGGYYRDITIIEGSAGQSSTGSELKSLTYEVAGHADKNGRVATDAAGRFKLPLYLSDLSGDIWVVLVGEDQDGQVSRAPVSLHDGRLKPSITLTSPQTGSSYGALIRVAGIVTDPYSGLQGMEGIESVSWLLSPVSFTRTSTPAKGAVTLGPGGAFRFSLPTKSLGGAQDLTLTATSRTGNRADLTIRLSQGDGDLSSFSLVPADRTVTVNWNPVAFVKRYDLSWTPNGAPPQKSTTMTGVTPPVKVTGLGNGTLYTLQVKAFFDDGSTGSSSVARFIPLSLQTLEPQVTAEYQQIRLAWKGIPGSNTYDVWRAVKGTKGFKKIAAALGATGYTDSGVEFGRDYLYVISPASILAPMSAPGSARSLPFPAEKLALIGSAAVQEAHRVTVSGGYAFVASGPQGVRVIDVSSPTVPVKVGEIDTTDARDVAVRGDYAYVADGDSGLRVLDVSTPRAPILIGTRKTTNARAVALSGNYAYVADAEKGLKVIDITDARDLPRVGQVETVNALGLVVQGNRLFLADGTGGLKIYDTRRASAPALLGSLATTDARQVSVRGTIAAIADGASGLRIVDVSSPSQPTLLATFAGTGASGIGFAAAVSLDDGLAFVADGLTGVKVVSLADPARPSLVASQAASKATSVSVENRLAYIADKAGLDLVRVQIQGRSFRVAACDTSGKAFDVSVAGDFAYVASHAQGIRVVDVSDPASVTDTSLTTSMSTRSAESVSVQDHFAYVADGSNGVRILDVAPVQGKAAGAVPVDVGAYRPGGIVRRVVPNGRYLFVAAGDRGVQVLDVSSPATPSAVSSIRTVDASDIALRGTWAFVADGDGGVKVLDLTDPANPSILPAGIDGNARRLALSGNLLVTAGDSGVAVIDVTDPRSPRLLSRYQSSTAQSVAARGNYAYVAEGYRGLTVLDLTRPALPVVVSSCDSVFAVGVALKDDYAIVVDSAGLRVIRILIPSWLMH